MKEWQNETKLVLNSKYIKEMGTLVLSTIIYVFLYFHFSHNKLKTSHERLFLLLLLLFLPPPPPAFLLFPLQSFVSLISWEMKAREITIFSKFGSISNRLSNFLKWRFIKLISQKILYVCVSFLCIFFPRGRGAFLLDSEEFNIDADLLRAIYEAVCAEFYEIIVEPRLYVFYFFYLFSN